MVIEQTMDATRRMLLKQNKIDHDEDKDLFPTEDFDTLTLESMLDSRDSENPAEKSRILRNGNPVTKPLYIIPSILMRTKRRRQTSNKCWLLNSIHHPRLPLLTFSKLNNTLTDFQGKIIYNVTVTCFAFIDAYKVTFIL